MILNSVEEVSKFIKDNSIKHFKAEEFVCPCCGKVIIDSDLILKLEDLRDQIKEPIEITSAYRCTRHNMEVNGKKNSAHLFGKAVDIKCNNSIIRYKILNTVIKYNMFNRIGISKYFIHLDIDNTKVSNVIWVY